jgi:hypothetical protein
VRTLSEAEAISSSVQMQLAHGPYPASELYGDGHVAELIANRLATLTPYVQKRLNYIFESDAGVQGDLLSGEKERQGTRLVFSRVD